MAFQMKMPGAQTDDVKKALKQIHSWLYQLNENLNYTFSHLDEENFTDAFLSTLSQNGTDAVKAEISKLQDRLDKQNSGAWMEIVLTNANPWASAPAPCWCVRGSCVYLAGMLSLKASLSNRSTVTIGELPEDARPVSDMALCVPTDLGAARVTVQTNGAILLRNISGYSLTTGTCISIACSFVK